MYDFFLETYPDKSKIQLKDYQKLYCTLATGKIKFIGNRKPESAINLIENRMGVQGCNKSWRGSALFLSNAIAAA